MKSFKKMSILSILTMVLSLIGLFVSAYLFNAHNHLGEAICNFNSVFSCNSVDQSVYSMLFGIPVSLLGIIFYLFVIIGLFKRIYLKKLITRFVSLKTYDFSLLGLLIFGVLFGVYLTLIEAFVIKAYCIYCLISFGITILLVVLFYYEMKTTIYDKKRKKRK